MTDNQDIVANTSLDFQASSFPAVNSDTTTLSSIQRPKPLLATRRLLLREVEDEDQGNYIRKVCFKSSSQCALDLYSRRYNNTKYRTLSSELKHLRSLAKLRLRVSMNSTMGQHITVTSVRYLSRVSSLILLLSSSGLHSNEAPSVFTIMRTLPLLHSLKLDFTSVIRSSPTKVEKAFSELRYLANLTTLQLKLTNYIEPIDENIRRLFQSLRGLTSLSSLHMNLSYCCHLTSVGIELLSIGLTRLKSLSVLSLNLKYSHCLVDQDIIHLCKSLGLVIGLAKLDLSISCYNSSITDKSIEVLCMSIEGLPSLGIINLDLSKCYKITKSGLKRVTNTLRQKSKLSKAVLNSVSII